MPCLSSVNLTYHHTYQVTGSIWNAGTMLKGYDHPNPTTDIVMDIAKEQSDLIAVFHFDAWKDSSFILLFVLAALMGSILNYAIFLCTTTNSALTTTVIGCLKNVLTTYIGMVFMPGYTFAWLDQNHYLKHICSCINIIIK